MERQATNVLILSAGAAPQDLASIWGQIPSGMVPINSKPAISWIVDSLLEQGFARFIVTTGFKAESVEKFLNHAYAARGKVEGVRVDYQKPPGNAILEALPKIASQDLLVVLGDTIVQDRMQMDGSFVYTSPHFADSTKWCLVKPDAQGNIDALFDKQELKNTEGLSALIGVYYFKDVNILREAALAFRGQDKIQISALLEFYCVKDPVRCIKQPGWVDIGHLDKYHEAKIRLARPREFNRLEYDAVRGAIKKRSASSEKLRDEIQWYQHLPDDLKILAPRVLQARIDQDPSITMEYYGYPTLAELLVYGAIHPTIWKQIIGKLTDILHLFLTHKGEVAYADYQAMYAEKTQARIARAAEQNSEIKALLGHPAVVINGQELKNIRTLTPFIAKMTEELYDRSTAYNCFLHGDFCFSNIMFDCASGVVRLIDPRGRWGATPYGDIRYDLAKLRHSVVGKYDYIINDFFTVKRSDNQLNIAIHNPKEQAEMEQFLDARLSQDWDLNQIKFVEGLLFLSMIPLHPERKERQLAMFATGLTRLNEVYDSRK